MRGPYPPGTAPEFRPLMEAVYEAFAARAPRVIEGCPCCLSSRKPDILLSKPLRELTGDDLYRYTTGVFLTIGSEQDFRYLLPRTLELAILEPGQTPSIEIVLGKLALAGWNRWAAGERQAVTALIDHWFYAAIERDLLWWEEEGFPGVSSGEVLCGAARAGLDIAPWLARLAEPRFGPIRETLASMQGKALTKDRPSGFWEDVPEAWRAYAKVLRR